MIRECKTMRDLHKIRAKMYKENKCLSPKERVKKTNSVLEKIEKKYGIKLRK